MSDPTTVEIGSMITRTPGICGGRPRIAGTGMSVRCVVIWYKLGLTPEGIADRIGHLSLAQVPAALAYYHANREEIETALAAEEAEADQLEQEHAVAHPPAQPHASILMKTPWIRHWFWPFALEVRMC